MISNNRIKLALTFLIMTSFCAQHAFAQDDEIVTDGRSPGLRVIQTGVPFLLIGPDSRAGGMGEAGVAVTPDVNATHWNPSKLAFLEGTSGFSVSYSPWLQRLGLRDVNLAYLNGFYRLDERNVIGGSLRFFSLGDIQLTDDLANPLGTSSPNELALDGTFARTFGENFSLGTALRFIRSNLSNNTVSGNSQARAAIAIAADVSAYLKKETVLFGEDARLAGGVNISNIGNKFSYSEGDDNKVYLPTNLRLGGAATFFPDDLNEFTFALDINKLLVPSPPVRDENGAILDGRDPSTLSVPAAIFGSFSDAPGGFAEELREISYSTGVEYRYNKQFALRGGYTYENAEKGGRSYMTVGAGLKYNVLNLDFSYVLANMDKTPLAQTLRFTLLFNFTKQ